MNSKSHKITWITPDYFLSVDAHVVPLLAAHYEIDWVMVSTLNSKRNDGSVVKGALRPRAFQLRYRQRDPRSVLQYRSLVHSVRQQQSDLVYTSFHGLPYFLPVLASVIDPARIIYGVHNVHTPKGAVHERWMRLYQRYAFHVMKRFHVFSRYQHRVISEVVPSKEHYYSPFVPEDYGPTTAVPPPGKVRFLFFGYIRRYKRLDLLIHAFQELYHSGVQNIELLVAGSCEEWKYYESLIDRRVNIVTRIGPVANQDIPDLISSSHYVVLPYQDGAQSAVLSLSYRYQRPVITSDIDAFQDIVLPGITGYQFKSLSSESLADVMREVVLRHDALYEDLKEGVRIHLESEYSSEAITSKYRAFLDKSLSEVGQSDAILSMAGAL